MSTDVHQMAPTASITLHSALFPGAVLRVGPTGRQKTVLNASSSPQALLTSNIDIARGSETAHVNKYM